MSIKEQLTADMKEAMKSHDKDRLSVIRFVRGAIRQAEIDGGHKELSDEDVIGVISKEVKTVSYTISEPTRQAEISYAVFCLKKKTSTPNYTPGLRGDE